MLVLMVYSLVLRALTDPRALRLLCARKASGCLEPGGAGGAGACLGSKRDSSNTTAENRAAVLARASLREVETEVAASARRLAFTKWSPSTEATRLGAKQT